LTYPFLKCLPSDSRELFDVSKDGIKFVSVTGNEIWNYPVVRINSFYNGEYSGINEQGISLLAFNIPCVNDDDHELKLERYPSYICKWCGKVQVIFQLQDFIPKNTSRMAEMFLENTISHVEGHANLEYSDEVINPYCRGEVDSYIFNAGGLSLREINIATTIKASAEHIKLVRGKGGRAASELRMAKSISKITDAVERLRAAGKPHNNQTVIAEQCGLTRKTVNKYWAKVFG
jgi:hypothetical protein